MKPQLIKCSFETDLGGAFLERTERFDRDITADELSCNES
jgi:hypothetical protein